MTTVIDTHRNGRVCCGPMRLGERDGSDSLWLRILTSTFGEHQADAIVHIGEMEARKLIKVFTDRFGSTCLVPPPPEPVTELEVGKRYQYADRDYSDTKFTVVAVHPHDDSKVVCVRDSGTFFEPLGSPLILNRYADDLAFDFIEI